MRIFTILSIILINFQLLLTDSLAAVSNKEIVKQVSLKQELSLCLMKKTWAECEKLAYTSKDPVLIKIVLSQKFLDCNYKNNNFAEIIKFIHHNPSWPQVNQLKIIAEKYLNCDTNPSLIVEWFNKHPPTTGLGYKFYALASKSLIKDKEKLRRIIKDGWIYGTFTPSEEQQYLSDFTRILLEEDHVKKIDEYLWGGNIEQAKKYLPYVSKGYQQNFIAQIAIMNNSLDKEQLFCQVLEKYYTNGLLFRYLASKKKEVPTKRSITLFKKVTPDKIHSPQWGSLQSYYAREFIDQKDFVNSYKIISLPIVTHEEGKREAAWFSGWLALSFLKKAELAIGHFQEFMKVVKKPLSVSRGHYWLARGYEAKGDINKARQFYKEAAQYSYSFYGQLASIELKQNKIILPKIILPKKPIISTKTNEVIEAIKYLVQYNQPNLGIIYAKEAIEKSCNPLEIAVITEIISSHCSIFHKVDVAKTACQYHTFIKNYAFPTPHMSVVKNSPIEIALVYSIIRQESVFNQYAVSTAKARGLMQLIEKTACDTAKSIGQKCVISKLTLDPTYNIQLGSNYLKEVLKKFDNSYLLAIISYNAGPHNVSKWIELFGDPRNLTTLREIVDWIELIPYSETRNYAQRVLENLQVYRTILSNNTNLKLKLDLLNAK